MALTERFSVNGADFSPLFFPGIGTFSAFSGNRQYRNPPDCNALPGSGPIPPGKYWTVSRPIDGLRSQEITGFKNVTTGARYQDWFALYRDNGKIDDHTWFKGVEQGNFRLHPNRLSWTVRRLYYVAEQFGFLFDKKFLSTVPRGKDPGNRSGSIRYY